MTRALRALGATPEGVTSHLYALMGPVLGGAGYRPIALTGNARDALEKALGEAARERRAAAVRGGDLLLGLAQSRGLAGRVLADLGVEPDRLRLELAKQ